MNTKERTVKITKNEIRKVLAGNRFEMSGYDDCYDGRNRNHGKRGSCVVHNTELLNRFAEYGIYEHTQYLYLDFYKGIPTLHFKYWHDYLGQTVIIDSSEKWKTIYGSMGRKDENMSGWTSTEIIERIFELTVYSGKPTRRTQQ